MVWLATLLLLVGAAGAHAEADPWYAAVEQADARVAAFEQAVTRGDRAAMQRAALELQADPIAVKRFNQNSTDAFRAAHNEVTDAIKERTRELMREEMAKKLGVKPEQVTTFEATNPPRPGDPVKVGQDWDVTVRVDGRDVHHTVSGQYVNDAYYEAVHGTRPPSAEAANALAHRQAIEVTSYQHPEAYGGAQSEGGRIISDPAGNPALRDPEQLGNTIDYKSRLPGNEAARLEAQGRFVEAQGFRMEQARQAAKQFDRQVAVRVAALGGEVPAHVSRAMDILRDIGDGKLTPTQGQRLLAEMGETIDSVASKSAGLIESAQTLRPGGLGAADDVFVENAKNRLRSKGIDPDGLKPLSPNADLSDLRGGGQAVRSWLGTAMKTLEVVGWAADFYELSQATREYLALLEKAMDPNTTDAEAEALFAKMEAAGMRIAALGGLGVLFEAYPPAAAVFGVYTITRLGLENTETGKVIDAAALGYIDRHWRAAEQANCDAREFLGLENVCAQLEDDRRDLLLAYLRAIQEGKLLLQKPFTAADLGKAVLAGIAVDDMLVRVDERERLLAANERYDALLAALAAAQAQCGNLDTTRASNRTYYEDTRALSQQVASSTAVNIGDDAVMKDIDYACNNIPILAERMRVSAEGVITASNSALQARSGSISRLQQCDSTDDLDAARELFRKGSALVEQAAFRYGDGRVDAEAFEVLQQRLAGGAARLDEIATSLNELDIRTQTLRNRVGVLRSMQADMTALEKRCTAQAADLAQQVDALAPILGDQVQAHRDDIRTIATTAAASTELFSESELATLEAVRNQAGLAQENLAARRAALAECSAVELPVAELVAMTTAADALPDIGQWQAEINALAGQCFAEINTPGDADTLAEEDDRRGDYEGFDADPGNVDPDRVAAADTGFDGDAPVGPAGLDERARGSGGQPGEVYDPDYTLDPLEEERRERERARDAERIATARDSARRGRDRDGDSIADRFGQAPDLSRLPDDGDDRRDPRDGRGGGDNRRGDRSDAPGLAETPDLPARPDLPANPDIPANPDLPPNPGLPQNADLPSNPGLPGQGGDDRDADEPPPAPPPAPEPEPEPPPVAPPADISAQCQRLANQLLQRGPRLSALFSQFQAAANAEDEERANRLACDLLSESDEMLSLFGEYEGAGCPLQSNVANLRSTLRSIRNSLQQGLAEQCARGGAATTSFAGNWHSRGRCAGNTGSAGFRWTVNLSQTGSDISGTITFHRCPGGGRATYRVSGVAGSGEEATLRGSLTDSRGPLADTARSNVTFTVRKNAAPSPNLAP